MKNAFLWWCACPAVFNPLTGTDCLPLDTETRRWAIRVYPLVGLLLGSLLALLALLLQNAPTPIAALALLSLWVGQRWLAPGWGNEFDALGSNQPLARRWNVKDPQIGSFGILALLFLLAWKGVLLWALLQYGAPLWWLVVLPALGRWGGAMLLVFTPCAQQTGLAWAWKQSLGLRDVLLALVPLLLLALFWSGIMAMCLATGLFVVASPWALMTLFQGINGDMVVRR